MYLRRMENWQEQGETGMPINMYMEESIDTKTQIRKKGQMKGETKVNKLINRIMLKMKILNDAYANNQLIAFRTPKEEWGETI